MADLMLPAYGVLTIPAVLLQSDSCTALNSAAKELMNDRSSAPTAELFGGDGKLVRFDDGSAVFFPASERHSADILAVLNWLHSVCAEADEKTMADAMACVADSTFDLSLIPPKSAHLMRLVAQGCTLLGLIAMRDEPLLIQCGLEQTFRKLCDEAMFALRDLGAVLSSGIDVAANSVCYAPRNCLDAAVRQMISLGLSLSSDCRTHLRFFTDSFGIRILASFRTERESLDVGKLRQIPVSTNRDLSFVILDEVIRSCGGDLIFESTDGTGELLLSLYPKLYLSDNGFYLHEFSNLERPRPSAKTLEYADTYNRK